LSIGEEKEGGDNPVCAIIGYLQLSIDQQNGNTKVKKKIPVGSRRPCCCWLKNIRLLITIHSFAKQ
jgi:hypothetical protein